MTTKTLPCERTVAAGRPATQARTQSQTRAPSRTRPGVVTAVVCLALAAVVAAMSSLNVALPEIARATHATQTQLAWIIDAYSLVFASMLLPAGAIGDRYGRRLALIAGLTIFGGASAVAMTAHSAAELIGVRAVMGLGAALVMPATLSTITGTFADEQRTRAVSVWAAVAGGAAVLGLLVSGLVLEVWSWPSVFGLNVILAAAAVAGTIRFVPESAEHDTPRLDLTGALLAVTGLVAVVYSIIEAPSQGWTSARTLAGLAAGLVILAGFVAFERRRRAPMLLVAGLIPLGAGMGLATTPATSGITSALPAARQGVGSALNDLSRELGGAVGIAVLASLLTGAYQSHLHLTSTTRLPAAQVSLARSSVAVATHLGGTVAAQAQNAFADGMHLALYVAAGIVTAAAAGVATLLRRRPSQVY
jgi:MFS family permease